VKADILLLVLPRRKGAYPMRIAIFSA
jgi:hypothetical protein